ncbi:MAG: exodeoxyribonuclease VII large subunit [Ottowia sp.]|nr:exodeoxyribonuclease VII large subunit [Ottowia sp.]
MNIDLTVTNPAFSSVALTVGQLNLAIARSIEQGLSLVRVGGEISNFTRAASGHWYFSLKDKDAQIRCVMFRGRNQALGFAPKEGQAIELIGVVSLYAARGEVQLNVENMRCVGAGDLFEAFTRLKEKLAQQGLFDAGRKRCLPVYPRVIGVITSLGAAALSDVLTALARRAPHIQVVVYPVPVQGLGAAEKLAAMLDLANHRAETDVLLLCRGGGSIEDLWAFNEEVLALAVARSRLPVVTGVGHETDFTIVDFVADVRAPTPTAAAELASPDRSFLLHGVALLAQRMRRSVRYTLEGQIQRVDGWARRLLPPRAHLLQQSQRLDQLSASLYRVLTARFAQARSELGQGQLRLYAARPRYVLEYARLAALVGRWQVAQQRVLRQSIHRVEVAHSALVLLNPQRTLERGYAVLLDRQGAVVYDPRQLRIGDPLTLRLAEGSAEIVLAQVGKIV